MSLAEPRQGPHPDDLAELVIARICTERERLGPWARGFALLDGNDEILRPTEVSSAREGLAAREAIELCRCWRVRPIGDAVTLAAMVVRGDE